MKTAILVEGTDARKFLQGQLTCDMNLLTAEQPLRGAHCNLKGRVEALYNIFLIPSGILLVTEAAVIKHALEKLEFYARFSKVKLSLVPVDAAIIEKYPVLFKEEFNPERARLHLETLGRFLPQELGLDETQNAISYTKGCYLGQEIVARLHYLGKLKKELVLVHFDHPVKPGEMIEHPEQGEVEVIDADGKTALVLRRR